MGRKPIHSKCGKTGHLAPSCSEKAASGIQPISDKNSPQTSAKPATKTSDEELSNSILLGPIRPTAPLSKERKGDWQVVSKSRGKVQTASGMSSKACVSIDMDSPTPHNCTGDTLVICPWTVNDPSFNKIQDIIKQNVNLKKEMEASSTPALPAPTSSSSILASPAPSNSVCSSSSVPSYPSKLKKHPNILPRARSFSPKKRTAAPLKNTEPPVIHIESGLWQM